MTDDVMPMEQFAKLALAKYPGKVVLVDGLKFPDGSINDLNNRVDKLYPDDQGYGVHFTREDLEKYQYIGILPNERGETCCPSCGSNLSGIFGSFRWEFVHGLGYCCECKETSFRYYHYIKEHIHRLEFYALVGWKNSAQLVEEDE